MHEFTSPHMATLWTLRCFAADTASASNAARAAFARVDTLEAIMTDYNPDSELMRLCRAPVGVPQKVSRDLISVLVEAHRVSRASEGVFDVTAGPLVQTWRRARRQHEMPEPARIREAQAVLGWRYVRLSPRSSTVTLLRPGIRLDLGGIAKGFAADAALQVLREHGFRQALVAASGDLAIGDAPPGEKGWPVRVGDPSSSNSVLGDTLRLQRCGVSTSGDLQQFVELQGIRYSHIVDPRTGLGLTNGIQATVVADKATRSDAWATALCILGPDPGRRVIARQRRLAALWIEPRHGTNVVVRSPGMPRPDR